MSAKDAFFQKIQDNKAAQQSQEDKVRQDIQNFRTGMVQLTQQIQQWLDGSGVEVTITDIDFQDETLITMEERIRNLSHYSNVIMKIKNNNKTAVISPLGVYGGGAIGWASLIIDNPSQAPRQEKYILRMSDEDNTWSIRQDRTPMGNMLENIQLTEDIFFQVISSLA